MQAVRRDLTAMLQPKSIALIGATDRSRWSQNTFDNLINRKYAGDVYLVSRRGGTVHGRCAAGRAWPLRSGLAGWSRARYGGLYFAPGRASSASARRRARWAS